MAHVHSVSAYRQFPLHSGWELLSVAPGTYQHPAQLIHKEHEWLAASVPGTVIETLQKNQMWDIAHPFNVDTMDWWYRCSFEFTAQESQHQIVLSFGGLATVTEVWLNEQHILRTDNMLHTHEVDVTDYLCSKNTIYIHFSSLETLLAEKRPRPRWRTQLVEHQQLRWFRTTLLGRMPGWSPPIRTVGPWRAVVLEERSVLSLEQINLKTALDGSNGYVSAMLRARSIAGQVPGRAEIVIDGAAFPLDVHTQMHGTFVLSGEAQISGIDAWWPYTHGSQPLYAAQILVWYGETYVSIDCGRLAFRTVELLNENKDDFGFRINGVPIFCRGACWTPVDMVTLSGTRQAYEAYLKIARNGGMNMLRIGGTMIYEDDMFYDLCDEAGILVWQDFMFANMDYPLNHDAFLATIQKECAHILNRLQLHPCLALLCGNSEIEQQVAMLGLPPEMWTNDYFTQVLPALCRNYVDIPYWPSSPSGGALPFQANAGNAHYQGVGAFLKSLEDARRSEVRFASECLAFANIPEDHTIDLFIGAGERPVHHPKWKERVPRDTGAGWDFEDIRDYYLEQLFHVDPMKLRYSDIERYLALSRVTTGEVMAYVFTEWRRRRSPCNGGLIWFFHDLWPGAGWGILDATGYPKAAYYHLRRVLRPITCFFSDEGLNGLWLHAVNDTETATPTEMHFSLYRANGTLLATTTKGVTLPPRNEVEIHVDALFERFLDLTYAFRFGPPSHDIVVTTMICKHNHQVLGEAFYFPHGLSCTHEADIGLQARITVRADNTYELTARTEKFAQSVSIRARDLLPEDNYFHMKPGSERSVILYPLKSMNKCHCSLSAINTFNEVSIYL